MNDDALASKYEGLLDDEGSKRLTLSEDKKLVFKGLILMKVSKIGLKGYITVEQGRKIFRLLFHEEGEDETSLEDVHNMVVGLGGRKLQGDDDEKFWLLIGAIGEGLSDGLSFEEATSVEYLVGEGFTLTYLRFRGVLDYRDCLWTCSYQGDRSVKIPTPRKDQSDYLIGISPVSTI